jgi:hypothetical protein
MNLSRIKIIEANTAIAYLADQDVSVTLALKILNLVSFYQKIKKEVDEYSVSAYTKTENLEEVAEDISLFINQNVEVEKFINIKDLIDNNIKVSSNKLANLIPFIEM